MNVRRSRVAAGLIFFLGLGTALELHAQSVRSVTPAARAATTRPATASGPDAPTKGQSQGGAATQPAGAKSSANASTEPSAAQPATDVALRRPAAPEGAWRVVNVFSAGVLVAERAERTLALRLIGVAEPRTPAEAADAQRFVAQLLRGESIVIRREPSFPRSDGENHEWAYVHRFPDDLFVNAELIRQGYAALDAQHEFAERAAFAEFEQRARQARKGIWAGAVSAANAAQAAGAAGDGSAASGGEAAKAAAGRSKDTGTDNSNGAPRSTNGPAERVFVTKSGSKFHRAGCRFVHDGCAEISVAEARRRGLGPCSQCRPHE